MLQLFYKIKKGVSLLDKKIVECLNCKQDSYILPFLWLHGEPKERVREEILAIKNIGISEFCAESRPYEGFCKDEWWDDFGFILKTAKELGMRVWLLDDKKFPSGYANGYLEAPERAHLRKRLIRELQIDVLGPMKGTSLFVGGRINSEEKILKVVAYKRTKNDEQLDYKSAIDLTSTLNDSMVYWDVPSGTWRVCITIETAPFEYKNDRLFYYIDMLNPDSCRAMIDAIYEPHYEHFKEYFGNTFAGFFSDEPGFLNVCYTYYNRLGDMYSPFPWRDDLTDLIAKDAGLPRKEIELYLPALWEDLGEITPIIRSHYMNVVTKLYSESFSYLLGNWCREHGVMYIGHVIEDMGAHMRLGYGAGHYFRALDGQDMAGIDIVLMQDIPGMSNVIHRSPLADGGVADPAFFRYTLPKLASSHAHIQPLKRGRAMCELFGAFGWAEGLPFMKGLADIMLASGVNYFVPHAFSPREEDTDCPPHFYNGGKNIQYPLFKNLMGYMGRCSHMLSDSTHKADALVFYNAEGEWCNENGHLFFDVCKNLTRGLIDFDIAPLDYLKDAEVENGRIYINNEDYGALIVSRSDILPRDALSTFEKLAKAGLPVIFIDSLPTSYDARESYAFKGFTAVSGDELVSELRARGLCHVCGNAKSLRFYHVTRENSNIYLFSNEDIVNNIDTSIRLEHSGECLIYEPWGNKLYRYECKNGELKLHLDGGNMIFVIFGTEIQSSLPYFTHEVERIPLPMRFDISVMDEGEDDYRIIATSSECFDISAPSCMPHFSGSIKYNTTFKAINGFDVIDLGQVGEVAEAWLNGQYLGARINAPYKFDMKDALLDGENNLEVVVKSNLAHKRRDDLSFYMQIPPSGIIGDISLCKYSK